MLSKFWLIKRRRRRRRTIAPKFLTWAAELGITDSPPPNPSQSSLKPSNPPSCLGKSLTVSHFPNSGGRGLAAARHLTKHELVLTVPKSALITSDTLISMDNKLCCSIRRYPNLSSSQMLSVCLLAEMGKGRSSRWHTYLMQFPRSYDTLAGFARFETQALQVDDAIWAAEKAVSKAELEWKEALPLMRELEFKHQLITFRSWLWASATISTRTMHIPWDEAGCLCPVGDFFNYAAPGEDSIGSEYEDSCTQFSSLQVSSSLKNKDLERELDTRPVEEHSQRLIDAGYDEDVGAYCFYARRNYRKGEQIPCAVLAALRNLWVELHHLAVRPYQHFESDCEVLLSYGTYTNLELLEHYGFILTTNPNEKVYIQLEPDVYSNSWPKESLYIQPDGKPSYALLCALRLWATPPNKRKSVGHLAYSGQLLSRENEMHVMRWIENKCCFLLDNVPSSVEEDIYLLDFADKKRRGQWRDGNWQLDGDSEPYANRFLSVNVSGFFDTAETRAGIIQKVKSILSFIKLSLANSVSTSTILIGCETNITEITNLIAVNWNPIL
ncbi:hypothetical protein Syun_022466 [Stephania yunnanensis]|uniref:Rubisco LSMT substrate-binding domain-containing protein n=1 Tax=Stephania yunnanensis TaxID=152371 RepID=A0AAP0I2W0_9MAGN